MRGYLPLLAPLLLALSSCGDSSLGPAQRLWTMADLQLSSHQNGACTNPGGLECNYFVDTGADGMTDVLQFKLAFSEGQPMGYMTTDFWQNYDRIWLEPMYILVTAWNDQLPDMNRLKGDDGIVTGPIFSVGPQSAFYSPYWQVFYVVVPAGTPATKYTAARQLFEDHLMMHTGPNRFASIGPDSVSLPTANDIKKAAPLILNYLDNPGVAGDPQNPGDLPKVVASSKKLTAWLDGDAVWYVDFGTDNFDVDAAQVILDVPLFLFKKLNDLGNLIGAGAPNVGGVAPLNSGISGRVSDSNRPHFGALWRLYIVTLPPSAAVFFLDNAMAIGKETDPAVLKKVNRVALNGNCFPSLATATDRCVWLDSQASIERNLAPQAIVRTTLEPACPFVMFNGLPVPNP